MGMLAVLCEREMFTHTCVQFEHISYTPSLPIEGSVKDRPTKLMQV